jgi:hypothetical protein
MCGGGIQPVTTCGRPAVYGGIRKDPLPSGRPVLGAFAVAAKSRPVGGSAKAGEEVTGRPLRRAVRCYNSPRLPSAPTEAG